MSQEKKNSIVEREWTQLSQKEHVKHAPNMYVGPVNLQNIKMYVLNDTKTLFVQKEVTFSPGLLKIFDEVLVNAIDHHTKFKQMVKNISIEFDSTHTIITVINDGPGIPIKKVTTKHDGEIYQPQAIFSQFLGGDNFNSSERIVGGQNGLGVKLLNCFSRKLKIETVDAERRMRYKQLFENCLDVINPPKITQGETSSPFTKVSFKPAFKELGYDKVTPELLNDLALIIEARAYQAAAFIGKDCKVTLIMDSNSINVSEKVADFSVFCKMFYEPSVETKEEIYHTVLKHPTDSRLDMELCIGPSDAKFRHVSLINGIWVYMGGNHLKHLKEKLFDAIEPKINKQLKDVKTVSANEFANNLFIFVKCSVINPQFDSQTKTKLATPTGEFSLYSFTKKDISQIWDLLGNKIITALYGKIKDKKVTRVNRGTVILEKGEDAKLAGDKKKAKDCTLFICEGDSALGLITSGINHKNTPLEKQYFGTFSIQGVPMNARKECTKVTENDTISIKKNEKFRKNLRFEELVNILGLDYNKTYDPKTEEGKAEFKTLRYGSVVIAVDQDEDGKGQIFGLIANFFLYFWPKLAEWGFLRRFNTPIIRAYEKGAKSSVKVKQFYSLYTFKKWVDDEFKGDTKELSRNYKIKYYKGLASHAQSEIPPLFNNFNQRLHIYEFDDAAEETFEIFYGKDTDARKKVLTTPLDEADSIYEQQKIPISVLLNRDTKEFQLYKLLRAMVHSIDSLTPVRRKTLYAARQVFSSHAAEMKVCIFAGEVIKISNYHHGPDSLEKSIIRMGQTFVGANNLPLLIGVGHSGTRSFGGDDHGSSRYVFTKLNTKLTDLLFPRIDDFLLEYSFDDGKRCEPKYYVPILPLSVLENFTLPAVGWKLDIWARDYKAVLKNVRKMINGEINKCKSLECQLWLRGNNCDIRYDTLGNQYMVGKYTYNAATNVVTVTELPISVYNVKYIPSVALLESAKDEKKKSKKKKYTELKPDFLGYSDKSNYDEATNIDSVEIDFELVPGTMEKWTSIPTDEKDLFTPVEKALNLCKCVHSLVNMMDKHGAVKEYKFYSEIVNDWFVERKKLYAARIDRITILLEYKILFLQNQNRFCKEHKKYGITNETPDEEANVILQKNKYDSFNKTLLFSPQYTKIKELKTLICNNPENGTNYDYILDMGYKKMIKKPCDEREEEIKKLKEDLSQIKDDCEETNGKFKGQKSWLKELEELEKIIDFGLKNGWSYSKAKFKFE